MSAVNAYLQNLQQLLSSISRPAVEEISALFWDNYQNHRRIIFCGNGGSAATASHLPADFQKNLHVHGGHAWECFSLVDSLPLLTAWSNDTEYANVFAAQARTWLRPNDLFIAISGSGNSPNILAAVEVANEIGAITVGWSGFGGGKLAQTAAHNFIVASDNMQIVEDVHMVLGHVIFTDVRDRLIEQLAQAA